MSKKKKIDKVELLGLRTLTGFEGGITIQRKDSYFHDEDSYAVIFILDDVTYMAIEDVNDGYRSSLEQLIITDRECKNKIPPHLVRGKFRKDDTYGKNDTVEFIDVITNSVVMAIGTDNIDDYYPGCVMEFNPTELAVNKEPEKYKEFLRERKLKRILN